MGLEVRLHTEESLAAEYAAAGIERPKCPRCGEIVILSPGFTPTRWTCCDSQPVSDPAAPPSGR